MEWIVASTPADQNGQRLTLTPCKNHPEDAPMPPSDTPTQADVYIFNSPADLVCFTEEIGHVKSPSNVLEFLLSAGQTPQRVPLSLIRNLRLGLLRSITPTTTLTEIDLNGGIDGPFLTQLISSWREAIRALNSRIAPTTSTEPASPGLEQQRRGILALERIEFDVWNARDITPRHIIRPIQEWSTIMHMRAKQGTETALDFRAVGCDKTKQEWLENAMPRQH